MRIGHEVVDQHDQQHAAQERARAVGKAQPRVVGLGEGIDRLGQDFGQGYKHHRAAGEGQAERQQARVGASREPHHQAAQRGCQPGRKGHRQGQPYVST